MSVAAMPSVELWRAPGVSRSRSSRRAREHLGDDVLLWGLDHVPGYESEGRTLRPCPQYRWSPAFGAGRPDAQSPVRVDDGRATPGGRLETNMSAAKVGPAKAVRPLTDEPIFEGRSVRGLLFGLMMAVLFWLLMAGLALTLF